MGKGVADALPTRCQASQSRVGTVLAHLCPPLPRRQRRFDRGERRVGLGAVGTAGLRHVRPAAAALAAERFGAPRTRSTALKRAVRSSVTPTTIPALPSSATPTIATTPDPTVFLPSSTRPLRSLGAMPETARPRNLVEPTVADAVIGAVAAAAHGEASCVPRRDRARACAAPRPASATRSARLVRPHLQRRRDRLEPLLLLGEVFPRRGAGQRLDAADARGDRALADERDQADLAGAADMGAAAELDRIGPPGHALRARCPSRRRALRRRTSRRTAPSRRTSSPRRGP